MFKKVKRKTANSASIVKQKLGVTNEFFFSKQIDMP